MRRRVVAPAASATQYALAWGIGVPLVLARRSARRAIGRTGPTKEKTVQPPNRP